MSTAEKIYNIVKANKSKKNGMKIADVAEKAKVGYHTAYQSMANHADWYIWEGSRGRKGYTVRVS